MFPTKEAKKHAEFAAALIHMLTGFFTIVTATEAQEVFRAMRHTKLVKIKRLFLKKKILNSDPGDSCSMKRNNEDVTKRKL